MLLSLTKPNQREGAGMIRQVVLEKKSAWLEKINDKDKEYSQGRESRFGGNLFLVVPTPRRTSVFEVKFCRVYNMMGVNKELGECKMDDKIDNYVLIGIENRKQSDFIKRFIFEHYGELPADLIAAQSAALKAFWNSEGYVFNEGEDEGFILPEKEDKVPNYEVKLNNDSKV